MSDAFAEIARRRRTVAPAATPVACEASSRAAQVAKSCRRDAKAQPARAACEKRPRMSKPTFAAALLAVAACASEPVSEPDAGASAAVRTAEHKALDRLEDRMTPPALVDETVIVPYRGTYPILGMAFHDGHHYVFGEERIFVLAADGTPVDRHGVAVDLPSFFFDDKYAIGAGDGRVGIVYEELHGAVRLRLYGLAGGVPTGEPVEVTVEGDAGNGRFEPTLLHGNGAWWVVYNSERDRHDAVVYRRFAADGTALDAAPVVIANAATDTHVVATFAGGRLVTAWRDGEATAMARVDGEGRLLDATPVRIPGSSNDLALVGDEHELLLRRGSTVQRLGHDLVVVGGPTTLGGRFLRETEVAPTGRGFRVVWTASNQTWLLDLPRGAEPGAPIALDDVRVPGAIAVGPDDATIIVHPGDTEGPPEVTRLATGGAVASRELMYEVLRSEMFVGLVGADTHRAVRWGRDYETVAAPLTAAGALLAAPEVQPRDTALVARTGGYWRVAATSVQPLDAALAPVGPAIDHGVGFARFAPLGDSGLLVWHQDGALRGQRIGAGGVLDAAPFAIAAGVSDATVAAGADEWLLTWAEGTAVRALRVGADGRLRDPAPREVTGGASFSEPREITAVHLGGGDYTVAWHSALSLRAARLSAVGGFAAPVELGDVPSSTVLGVVADGASTLILTWNDALRPTGALHRLDATGWRVGRALPHELPAGGIVRTGPGRFLVLADVPWVVDGASGRRLVARVLTLDGDGVACTSGDECVSGVCADGVCCDRACGSSESDCAACSVAAGAARDGVCGPRQAGAGCRAATGACDAEETCDGASTACPADGPAADDTTCDDGDRCTTGDACRGGACGGAAVECPAPGECQTAACDADQGCVTAPVRDGTACTGGRCTGGECTAAPVDAGAPDAGAPDAGAPDAGAPDAGMRTADAGMPPADGDDDGGCGCQGNPSTAPIWVGLVGVLALARRRTRRA
jgi:hypothetical protein